MSDYTPTTDDIEDAWCSRSDGEHSWASGEELRGYEAEFNRWLEQVKAEAWDEGNAAGWTEATARHENVSTYPKLTITNPYRKAQHEGVH